MSDSQPQARPLRIQRRRTKGARLPPNTVCVTRPSIFGNPFPWRGDWIVWAAVAAGYRADLAGRKAAAVAYFRAWLTRQCVAAPEPRQSIGEDVIEYPAGHRMSVAEAARGMAASFAVLMDKISVPAPPPLARVVRDLRGKNLACYCKLCDAHRDGKPLGLACPACEPCHSDVLGEIANA